MMGGGPNMLGDQASWDAFCAQQAEDRRRYETWGPHMRALWDYLQDRGMRIGGVIYGSDPDATAEDRAENMLAALKELEAGGGEIVADIGGEE